jgi:hypothetical protein
LEETAALFDGEDAANTVAHAPTEVREDNEKSDSSYTPSAELKA